MQRFFARFLWLAGLVGIMPTAALATTQNLYSGHRDWQSAQAVTLKDTATFFGQLGGQGDARFVAFTVSRPQSVRFILGTPEETNTQFQPQAVVFVPDSVSAGPILPIDQPPGTMGLVFGTDAGKRTTDTKTQIVYLQQLSANLVIEKAGTVYVAVYNADKAGGRFRLDIVTSQPAKTSLLSWPGDWWRAQSWAGLTARTLVFPAGVAGVLALIVIAVKLRRRILVKTLVG